MRKLPFGWIVDLLVGSRESSSREQILSLKLTTRRLQRSQKKLEIEERKLKKKVQSAIRKGDVDSARQYATDMIRSQKWALGYQKLTSRINGLVFKLEQADAAQTLGREMLSIAHSLRLANETLRIPDIDNVISQIEHEMDNVDMSVETLEDGLDQLLVGDTDTDEVDLILAKTAAEVGVDTKGLLPTPSAEKIEGVSDLEDEIQALRKKE